jgi:hypothetical protein
MKKDPCILFFIAGANPTAAEELEAMELGSNVRFRNRVYAQVDQGALEACAGVAGTVPDCYKDFPKGADVVKKAKESHLEALKAAKAKAADGGEKPAKESAKEKKDRLEAYAREKFNVELDKRKSVADLELEVAQLEKAAEQEQQAANNAPGWTPNA